MKNDKALILNPYGRPEGEKLLAICKGYPNLDVQMTSNPKALNMDPDLVFIITNGLSKEELVEFDRLLDGFHANPVIGVLTCDNHESVRDLENRKIWSWLSAPLRKIDVCLQLNQILSPARQSLLIRIKAAAGPELIKGHSKLIQSVRSRISQVSKYDVTVLINGETGTGKELCAKMLHFLSRRSSNPFVPVNCGSIPKDLFENELFGHCKGAFTNATDTQSGLIQAANCGTLFLDEIEAMPLSIQAKLLRFLEDRQFKPLGQSSYMKADVRIVAAAKGSLPQLVEKRRFREDLYYRLNVVNINLPPLNERTEDIPVLVEHFLNKYAELYNKPCPGIAPRALLKLLNSKWPGNVRQLENLIHGLMVTHDKPSIDFADLPFDVPCNSDPVVEPLQNAKEKMLQKFECHYLKNILLATKGNISLAAKLAGKERSSFCRLLKKHCIDIADFRDSFHKKSIIASSF